jgi:hypothetical protein
MGHRLGFTRLICRQDRDQHHVWLPDRGRAETTRRGQATNAQPKNIAGVHFCDCRQSQSSCERAETAVAAIGGTVNLAVGTITPGSTVVLTYQVTVNNAAPAGVTTISNKVPSRAISQSPDR